jgi:hypothetical protein
MIHLDAFAVFAAERAPALVNAQYSPFKSSVKVPLDGVIALIRRRVDGVLAGVHVGLKRKQHVEIVLTPGLIRQEGRRTGKWVVFFQVEHRCPSWCR